MSKDFNIDDILLEAQMLRSKKEQGDFPSSKAQVLNSQKKFDDALETVADIKAKTGTIPIPKISFKDSVQGFEYADEPPKFTNTQDDDVPITFNIEDDVLVEPSPKQSAPSFSSTDSDFEEENLAPKTRVKTKTKTKPQPKTPIPVRNAGDKKDLFDFQPEKREKPIATGAFGQKRFTFNKPKGAGSLEQSNTEDLSMDFKLAARSSEDVNSGVQPETEFNIPTAISPDTGEIDMTENPFEREFGPSTSKELKKEQIKARYNKLVSGESADAETPEPISQGTTPFSAESAKTGTGKIPKSLFATFATGTGREINIDEIKKIDFSSLEGAGGYYDYEDDVDNFSEDLPEGRLNFDEFSPHTARQDVAKNIADTKLGIFTRTGIIAILTFTLFYISASARNINLPLPEFMFPTGSTLVTFILVQIVLCGVLLVVCANTAISGITSLFKMQANSDTLVTFSLIGAIVQGFVLFRGFRDFDVSTVTFLAPVASTVLLFNYIAKLGVLSRIQRNFRIVASNREKNGISSISSPAYCRELMPKITENQPNIVFGGKSDFFNDFLALSFSTKYDVGINRAVAPVCIIGAVIVAMVTKFLLDDNILAATSFASIICISATLSTTFIENIPLSKVSKELTPHGAMISGNKAIEDFSDAAGVVLTENDLFSRGHVYLNGIKAFPKGRIDQAILDAASVLCVLDGPLGHMFLDMIGGDKKLLKKVDNVVYENNMGLSGWVDGRRVLIGNRMLMQNHSIKLPNDSYERANLQDTPGNPIYVSNSGEVSARFLVEYTADEELGIQLDRLALLEKELIVYTTDSNITPKKIWEIYGYPVDLVTIMSSELQDSFREFSAPQEEMPAEIVYVGKASNFVSAIIAAIHARSSILTGTVFQFIQIVFGYAMITLMAFTGSLLTFGSTKMTIYLLIWFIAIVLAQKLKRS